MKPMQPWMDPRNISGHTDPQLDHFDAIHPHSAAQAHCETTFAREKSNDRELEKNISKTISNNDTDIISVE